MDKILGWPEPTEVGGHMVKRSDGNLDNKKAVFTCVDCGTQQTGGVGVFQVGLDGCTQRPESLDFLSIEGHYRDGAVPIHPATQAREHWLGYSKRLGLKVEGWQAVDGDDGLCAVFTFNNAHYDLRYNQRGPHGVHHIHAVKIKAAE